MVESEDVHRRDAEDAEGARRKTSGKTEGRGKRRRLG
jgi:hypothetical protein